MPEFPRKSRSAVQTQLRSVNYTEHIELLTTSQQNHYYGRAEANLLKNDP